MSNQVSFDVSSADTEIIRKIVDRADGNFDMMMDITACHANGCALNLAGLLNADDFNFAHDVYGISTHINRKTGKLEHCFCPRFIERQS